MKSNKTLEAFERYCQDGNVQFALGEIASTEQQLKLVKALLYDCFVSGSQYAVAHCESEHGACDQVIAALRNCLQVMFEDMNTREKARREAFAVIAKVEGATS